MTHLETDLLKDLHDRLIDSCDGYRDAAKKADLRQDKETFEQLQKQRQEFAGKIAGELTKRGEEITASGSLAAAAHRTWTNIAATIGDANKVVTREINRGEEHLLGAYDKVLDSAEVTDSLYAELNRQRVEITKNLHTEEKIAA